MEFSQSEGTYASFSIEYANLSYLSMAFVLICLALLLLDLGTAGHFFTIFNLALLLTVCMRLIWLLGLKDPSLNESLDTPFNELVLQSAFYDRLSVFFAGLLILIQTFGSICLVIEKRVR